MTASVWSPDATQDIPLSAQLAQSSGSTIVNHLQDDVKAVVRSLHDKVNDWFNVRDVGITGDGATDVTLDFQSACAGHKFINVPAGTYIINSVSINADVTINCEPGVIFKRAPYVDLSAASYASETAMFYIKTCGVTLRIIGSPTFDGNNANQTPTEPSGAAIKTEPPAVVTAFPINIYIENAKFINGTSNYLNLRGDDIRRRYDTNIVLHNCKFYDTVYGKGKGDPSTPTALGYSPTYVRCLDYVKLITNNFYATFAGATALGQYAAVAILGTFAGGDYTQAGSGQILMFGNTEVSGLGRASSKYNDANDYSYNNGIGVIDAYGNWSEIFIEQLTAKNNHFVSVRAKASLKRYTILQADIQGCVRGIQVSPSSTGASQTVINVSNIMCKDGTVPQVEFSGTSSADQVYSIDMTNVYCFGTQTNPENLANQGNIRLANSSKLSARGIAAIGSPTQGITLESIDRIFLDQVITNQCSNNGIKLVTGANQQVNISNFDIRNSGAEGIYIADATSSLRIKNGRVYNSVTYALNVACTTGDVVIEDVIMDTVTGLSRGMTVAGGADAYLLRNRAYNITDMPAYFGGKTVREQQNSWNAKEVIGTFSNTTIGTNKLGDRVINNNPTAGGNIGWVCTAAGSPGTWKSYGTIAA